MTNQIITLPRTCCYLFFDHSFTLKEYLALDDGVLTTYFAQWRDAPDKILSDLAARFF